jgi:2,3-dihydroxybenzoate decarboxylase
MEKIAPFFPWRLDQRARAFADRSPEVAPSELGRRNTRITTAGSLSDEPLYCALDEPGEDNVMYSVDYPFESITETTEWLDTSKLDPQARAKIEHENAQALLKLDQPGAWRRASRHIPFHRRRPRTRVHICPGPDMRERLPMTVPD